MILANALYYLTYFRQSKILLSYHLIFRCDLKTHSELVNELTATFCINNL